MAIYRLLQNSAFEPEQIDGMITAYEHALRVLGLADRTDSITEAIAKKIVEIAQTGVRDPAIICARTIEGMQPSAANYLQYADECRRLAAATDHKKHLTKMATAWEALASGGEQWRNTTTASL